MGRNTTAQYSPEYTATWQRAGRWLCMGWRKYTQHLRHCNTAVPWRREFIFTCGLRASFPSPNCPNSSLVLLLLDIGNTHTHAACWERGRVINPADWPTTAWAPGKMLPLLARQLRGRVPSAVALCSVVPAATLHARHALFKAWGLKPFQLTNRSARGIGIDYPNPSSIGPDRLANAIGARALHGTPVVVVGFGTAVAFDIVNRRGNYVGGIIAPGLAAMTSYLHEKTALLPEIKIREINSIIGKSTEQAMLIGAVHGYRGLIRELIQKLKVELNCDHLPVVATGGYAELMAKRLPEISAVDPLLTLKGLRLAWQVNQQGNTR